MFVVCSEHSTLPQLQNSAKNSVFTCIKNMCIGGSNLAVTNTCSHRFHPRNPCNSRYRVCLKSNRAHALQYFLAAVKHNNWWWNMHPICNTICCNIPDRPANAADTRQKIACRFVVFATNKQLACSRPLNRPKKLSKHTNRLHCEPMPQTEPVPRLYVNRTRRFVADSSLSRNNNKVWRRASTGIIRWGVRRGTWAYGCRIIFKRRIDMVGQAYIHCGLR